MVDARWYYIHTLASYVILVCAVLRSRPPSRPFPASGGPWPGNEYTPGGVAVYCIIRYKYIYCIYTRCIFPLGRSRYLTVSGAAYPLLTWRHARPRGQSSASPAACPCSLPALHSSLASLVALPPPAHPCSAPPTSSSQVSLRSQLLRTTRPRGPAPRPPPPCIFKCISD